MTAASTAAPRDGASLLYTMIRVADLDRALGFYVDVLGMTLFRRRDYPDGRFTLAFVGYGDEANGAVIELTHNWGDHAYEHGSAFGHIAIGVPDVHAVVDRLAAADVRIVRPAGPMKADPAEVIAFVEDPDGHRIELVQVERRARLYLANYLFFTTYCEQALSFYTECGLGSVTEMLRYGVGGMPVPSEAFRGKVMHAKFEGPGVLFYASDNDDAEPMRGSAHILMLNDRATTLRVFEQLSVGGRVTTPLGIQSWGDFYGKLTDRFGVQWMLNCSS